MFKYFLNNLYLIKRPAHKLYKLVPKTYCQMNSSVNNTSQPVKVAVAQMTSKDNLQTNLQTCKQLAHDAKRQDCKMLFLPECFAFLGHNSQQSLEIAEPLDGNLMQQYRLIAQEYSIWLSLGGFQRKGLDAQHLFNCHVIVDNQGKIMATYDKIHLFNVDVPNGPVLMESNFTHPGNKLVVCDSPAGRLGVTICYDLRFPELYQKLRFDFNADIMLVPSAFTKTTGEAHWETLLRARAIECQCYVIAAAQAGIHNEKRVSYGHSLIIDPWGKVIGKLDDPLATGIAVAEINLEQMKDIRLRIPIEEHRKDGRSQMEQGKVPDASPQ
eukprot:TRINITY_DN3148_c0_g3_i1.p1 TRINITY_DN3148_c0_g3~~TRINITY_DN3148_c0_g3_i1.p1  ORF type:complete len:353 (-),score=13.06 TRINITY_DN3148_c0_g3_i1:262-1239(-)